MSRVRNWLFSTAGALVVLSALWGCNGTNVDDPESSDSLLIVDSVSPASVQSDVTGNTDPNTLFVSPPADDKVDVDVRNLNRAQQSGGIFGDIQITSLDLICANGTLQMAGSTTGIPASLTLPAGGSGTISVVVATGAYKLAFPGLVGANDTCSIQFNGQDLGGEPIVSQSAVFGISYVDTP